MRVEQLFENFPPVLELRDRYLDPDQPEASWPRLAAFLDNLANSARDGIISLASSSSRSGAKAIEPEEIRRIVEEGKPYLDVIMLASLLPCIPEMISNQTVSVEQFIDRVKNYTIGTPLRPAEISDEYKAEEFVQEVDWLKMISCAQGDKTLATFLRDPSLFPEKMRKFLDESGFLPGISVVLDEYEKRARIIIRDENGVTSPNP